MNSTSTWSLNVKFHVLLCCCGLIWSKHAEVRGVKAWAGVGKAACSDCDHSSRTGRLRVPSGACVQTGGG